MTAASRLTVVVAPDSFKGSLPAHEVAAAIEVGLRDAVPGGESRYCDARWPTAARARWRSCWPRAGSPVERTVRGPTGAAVRATFALSPTGCPPRTAVVELAAASGLTLLPDGPDPLRAGTYGTGELAAAALDSGVDLLVLAIGGSATTDGGTGMASALGAHLRTRRAPACTRGGRADRPGPHRHHPPGPPNRHSPRWSSPATSKTR